jgi:hypothetical protein
MGNGKSGIGNRYSIAPTLVCEAFMQRLIGLNQGEDVSVQGVQS